MRDLRKQALESHKTVSRKQQARMLSVNGSPTGSKPTSRHGSTLNTPAMSRTGSRTGSQANSDEDDYLSDDTIFSGGSDMMASIEELGDPGRSWEDNLGDRMEELIDWKRSTSEGRELCLRTFTRMLQAHYAMEEISGQEQNLLTSFLRSVKNENSEVEVIRALKAIEMLMVTSGDSDVSEGASNTVQRAINYSESVEVKTQAIRTWVFLMYYSGASDEDTIKSMDFLVEIIESDGASIEAQDQVEPVVAAIEGYSFLATLVDDLSDDSAEHAEALYEQLDSSSPHVQVAAGEALALLYEKSYTEPEEDESVHRDSHNAVLGDDEKIALVRRYQAAHNYRDIVGKLVQISSTSGRSSRRKDVKAARTNFRDILNSIEHPTWGPRYSAAEGRDHTRAAGSTLSVQVGNSGVMKIDRWWKLICLQSLKKVLQGGFLEHYEKNPLIIETLPVLVAKKANHTK